MSAPISPCSIPCGTMTTMRNRVEVSHKQHADIPELPHGQHLWAIFGVWRIVDPTASRIDLDYENLITIDGPGCYVCEETYSPKMAERPCPGEPN